MNLALGPLLVLLLLLPGMAYQYVYSKRPDMTRRDIQGFSGDLMMIVVASVATHSFAWLVLHHLSCFNLLIDDLLAALSGGPKSYEGHEHEVFLFLGYCIAIMPIPAFVAWRHRLRLPPRQGWDVIFGRVRNATDCVVDVLVEINGRDVMYQGVVMDYYLNSVGNLERLVLNGVLRTTLGQLDGMPSKTEEEYEKVYRPVAGDGFVIFASCIKNINVTLVDWDPWEDEFTDEDDEGPDQAEQPDPKMT